MVIHYALRAITVAAGGVFFWGFVGFVRHWSFTSRREKPQIAGVDWIVLDRLYLTPLQSALLRLVALTGVAVLYATYFRPPQWWNLATFLVAWFIHLMVDD